MAWQLSPLVFLHLAICLAMAGIAVTAYRHHDIDGARPLTALATTTAVWAGANAGYIARTDLAGQVLFANFAYLPIALTPVALLYFAEAYTGRPTPLTRSGPLPLLLVPAVTQVVVWTNGVHELFFAARTVDTAGSLVTLATDWGPWFWVHSAYSYGLIVAASGSLLRTLIVTENAYTGQSAAILVGILTPLVSNALYLGGLLAVPVDPTPAAFAVTVVAFVVAIYRHRLLQMVPVAREVARDELLDSLVEAVFILDEEGRIVDCNAQAHALAETEVSIGDRLPTVAPDLAAKIEELDGADDDEPVAAEVALRQDGRLRHFDVRITRLRRAGGVLTGRLVSLRDVTERRQREQRLDVLNRTLRHDLRNEANVVLGYAELGQQRHPDAEWLVAVRDHVSGLVDMSEKVRQIEQALDEDTVEVTTVDVVPLVEGAVADVGTDHPDLTVRTDLPDSAPARAIEQLDAAIRHAIENAVEHNDNPDPLMDVAVSVTRRDDTVAVTIVDNGPGIPAEEQAVLLRGRETQLDHVSGLGLWMINWIVTKSGGEIDITDNDPRGSVVTIRLPAADDHDPDAEAAETRDRETTTPSSAGGAGTGGTTDERWDDGTADGTDDPPTSNPPVDNDSA